MAQQPKSLAVTKINKISESPDIWVITILHIGPVPYLKCQLPLPSPYWSQWRIKSTKAVRIIVKVYCQ